MYFSEMAAVCEGVFISSPPSIVIQHLSLDTRKVTAPEGTLFFAIRGKNHDAHEYISIAYAKGIRAFVIEADISIEQYPDAGFFKTTSTIQALQHWVAHHRAQFTLPVIGITGSNAKTIIKEWLYQVLQSDYCVARNPKSYNSQIGVPLSVWSINERHTLGIFEAGISQPDEMRHLEKVIQPSLGIFTTIGSAHDEGFKDRFHKIKEKAALFTHCKTVILCRDHTEIIQHPAIQALSLFTWSMQGQAADIQWQALPTTGGFLKWNVVTPHWEGVLQLPFTDKASIENAAHVVAVLVYFGYPVVDIQKRIDALQPLQMRLELKQAKNDCYIIDDTYNNDLAGIRMALDFMLHVRQRHQKTVILSDVLESGIPPEQLYQEIAGMLQAAEVQRVFCIGKEGKWLVPHTTLEVHTFDTVEDFLTSEWIRSFSKEIILIKGARSFSFERIVQVLEWQQHETRLEVNLNALAHNLNVYRSRLKPGVKTMGMVKALAYGSGAHEVALWLQQLGVHYLAVAYTDEGVQLREQGVTLPIMVMNAAVETFDRLVEYKLEPEIYRLDMLDIWLEMSRSQAITLPIHLKWDTGMRRLGMEHQDVDAVVERLKAAPTLRVASCFTHLAGSDEVEHDAFTQAQLDLFLSITEKIEAVVGYPILRHAANSAAILRLPETHLDMVRLGIGLYGVESSGIYQNELKAISTFKTHISQLRTIEAGVSVGYSRRWVAQRTTRVATIEVGYADGYDRRLSNGVGEVGIRGQRCPVIGNVCMDMTMIDVTDVPNCAVGDEVQLFGDQITIPEVAAKIGTIGYEVLTGIGDRVKRIYFSEE
ncbi:MAG: bifunctional UDP-N-acetylmuramoyl-tripeptide:D-alanyl-D-alanine ligase/alanine racemase [Cytophagaceae bacterium]|jgi:alanine racemase|nr:bifunctional UDP-N-acetylmuramoyl-tripeptide:D-alanyl-D-alanine ligase/alanine racemase [Cytophagaceae bacterium]